MKCAAITKKNTMCSRNAKDGKFCKQHCVGKYPLRMADSRNATRNAIAIICSVPFDDVLPDDSCAYCLITGVKLEKDHVFSCIREAILLNEFSSVSNVQVKACPKCNQKKSNNGWEKMMTTEHVNYSYFSRLQKIHETTKVDLSIPISIMNTLCTEFEANMNAQIKLIAASVNC